MLGPATRCTFCLEHTAAHHTPHYTFMRLQYPPLTTNPHALPQGKGEQRLIKVVASPCLGEAEASFCCSAQGVADFKD